MCLLFGAGSGGAPDHARMLTGSFEKSSLHIDNPYNTAVRSHMVLACNETEGGCTVDRGAFLQGNWIPPRPCLTMIPAACSSSPKSCRRAAAEKLRYVLSYGATQKRLWPWRALPRYSRSGTKGGFPSPRPTAALTSWSTTFCRTRFFLPYSGTLRVLPVRRGLWLSRPAAGLLRVPFTGPAGDQAPDSALLRGAIRPGGRAALVAQSAKERGRAARNAHPLFRRPALAALYPV